MVRLVVRTRAGPVLGCLAILCCVVDAHIAALRGHAREARLLTRIAERAHRPRGLNIDDAYNAAVALRVCLR